MVGESQRVPASDPDPSVYVQAAIDRAARHHAELVDAELRTLIARLDAMDRERRYLFDRVDNGIPAEIAHALDEGLALLRAEAMAIVQRINDIDKATELLAATVNRVPSEITKEIMHLRGLLERDLQAVDLRFVERDKRFDIRDRDSKEAIAAALASAHGLATQQEVSNSKAIEKAERATHETIVKNAEVVNKSIEALTARFDDLRDRLVSLESEKRGAIDQRTEHRVSNAAFYATVGIALTVVLAAITIIGFIAANSPG